jgi:hypothetical protein
MITRQITKRNGDKFTVLLDEADADIYDAHCWYMINGYVARTKQLGQGKTTTSYLHRELLRNPRNKDIDHKDGNKLNNSRANLRACSKSQNGSNRRIHHTNNSGYKGVCRHSSGKWQATIGANGRYTYLGLFDTPAEAAVARDREAIRLHKEFARLNFPELALAS